MPGKTAGTTAAVIATAVLEKDKETAGAVRYRAKADGAPPPVDTIYIRKWAFEGGIPEAIEIVVSAK